MASLKEYNFAEPLFGEIARFIADGREDVSRLTDLAFRLAELHYARIPVYRRLAEMRGWSPGNTGELSSIPAVPTEAFKRTTLHIEQTGEDRFFSTSGTSAGEDHRGRARYSTDDLALMDIAIDVNAERFLFPDYPRVKTRLLILAPSPEMAPAMIMAYGMDRLKTNYGLPESGFLVGPDGLDSARLVGELNRAVAENTPVTIIGASFGFVHLFDAFAEKGLKLHLPENSRAMDAGGFKGKSRQVSREELVESFEEFLGIAPGNCVNLLGLTEFASQFYDDSLAAAFAGRKPRRGKQHAPWTRSWAVHPETLRTQTHGETGLLLHLDLANGGHPFMVLTDDLGITNEQGFEVIGRAGDAESRGCSITVDEMMSQKRKG